MLRFTVRRSHKLPAVLLYIDLEPSQAISILPCIIRNTYVIRLFCNLLRKIRLIVRNFHLVEAAVETWLSKLDKHFLGLFAVATTCPIFTPNAKMLHEFSVDNEGWIKGKPPGFQALWGHFFVTKGHYLWLKASNSNIPLFDVYTKTPDIGVIRIKWKRNIPLEKSWTFPPPPLLNRLVVVFPN